MQTYEKNIINLFGQMGSNWLQQLPTITEFLADKWHLTDLQAMPNLTWNFVAAARRGDQPVVLKFSCDAQLIQDEYATLMHFQKANSIHVLDYDSAQHALLLERALPGVPLKQTTDFATRLRHYEPVAQSLTSIPLRPQFKHVSSWCMTLDRIQDARLMPWLDQAFGVKKELLSSLQNPYVCHADLHLDNIIAQGDCYVAIDPKGIIGDLAFEASAFDLTTKAEFNDAHNAPQLITSRIRALAQALQIDHEQLKGWIFLRAIFSAQWFIEDNGDPSKMIQLLHYLDAKS